MSAALMAEWHLNNANIACSLLSMSSKGKMRQVPWREINNPPCGGPGWELDDYKWEEILNE